MQGIILLLLSVMGWIGTAAPVKDSDLESFSKKHVTLVADDWCPQHCEGKTENKGYIVDIVEAAYAAEGFTTKIAYLPWLRALFEVKKGNYDGLLTPTVQGYPQFLFHQEAVGYQEYCVYTKKDRTWKYSVKENFLDQRVASLKDSGLGSLEDYFLKHKDRIVFFEFVGTSGFTKKIFDFLEDNRTDAIIISSDVYHYSLKQKLIADSFREAGCLGKEKLAVGFSKAHKHRTQNLAKILDSGINKLRETGQLKKILERYGMDLWARE